MLVDESFPDLQIAPEDLAQAPPVDLDGEVIPEGLPERFERLLLCNPRLRTAWESSTYPSLSHQAFALMGLLGACGLSKGEAAAVNVALYARQGRKEDGLRKVPYNLKAWAEGRARAEARERDAGNGPPPEREAGEPGPEVGQPEAGDGRPAEPGTERPGKIRILSLEELMATNFPPRRAHVGHGILPAQGKALLTGHGGVGKTVLLLQSSLELAAGRAWLGRWLGDGPSRVGLLLQEDPLEITQWRLRQLMRGLGLEDTAPLAVFLNDPARYLNVTRDEDLAWIITFVKERGLDLLIPDPLITFHRENENDNARMRYVLDRFTAVQAETGCAVLLVHHHRKSPEGSEDFDAARGARAIQDWARTVVNLTAQKKVDGRDRIRMTFTKLNYGPMPPGALTLERDPETLLVRVVEEEEMCSPERAAQVLEEAGGDMAKKTDWYEAIRKATGCSDRTARGAGAEAVKRGLVVEGERTKEGQPVRVAGGVSFGSCGNRPLPQT